VFACLLQRRWNASAVNSSRLPRHNRLKHFMRNS
jgi:hypothetical protein